MLPIPLYSQGTVGHSLSELPSRGLVPRPRELEDQLAPVAKVFSAKTCSIRVWMNDDIDPASDPIDTCYRGEFRYDGDSWSTVEDDVPCWQVSAAAGV